MPGGLPDRYLLRPRYSQAQKYLPPRLSLAIRLPVPMHHTRNGKPVATPTTPRKEADSRLKG
jgi:hypothetical protein